MKISSASVLSYANKFFRQAQSFSYAPDAMKKELDNAIGKGVQQILTEFLNTKPISSVDLYLNYDPSSKKISFQPMTNNGNKEIEAELNNTLSKFISKASAIVSKYQKDKPLNSYKYISMEV
jgi:hypothetical protein